MIQDNKKLFSYSQHQPAAKSINSCFHNLHEMLTSRPPGQMLLFFSAAKVQMKETENTWSRTRAAADTQLRKADRRWDGQTDSGLTEWAAGRKDSRCSWGGLFIVALQDEKETTGTVSNLHVTLLLMSLFLQLLSRLLLKETWSFSKDVRLKVSWCAPHPMTLEKGWSLILNWIIERKWMDGKKDNMKQVSLRIGLTLFWHEFA